MIPLRSWLRTTWLRVRYPRDVLAGSHAIGLDLRGRPLVLDEMSIRNVLVRVDPLCATAHGDHVRVPVAEVVEAIADRIRPIHRGLPNRLAGAPRRDRAALRRLRELAEARRQAGPGAHLLIPVPTAVAGWIRLRHRHAERLIEKLAHEA